jgi:hypothetical protein
MTDRAPEQRPHSAHRPQAPALPYNPGGYTFGWFNRNPPTDNTYLKLLPSEFYVWTHAYDVSGINAVTLKVRIDADGVNSMATNQNETYAGGPEVGTWIDIPMTKRALPNTQVELNAAANNGQINYFITPPELADYYFAKVTDANLSGFRGKLVDYYIQATDSRGNVSKSDIQHVFVEDDGNDTPVVAPGPTPFAMDGVADFPGYQLSAPGMTIHAALREDTLYVATWAPGANGNDHFIMIGDSALASAATIAPWAKSGLIALPAASPFLAAESSNNYIGWFDANGADTETARAEGQRMEGTIDLAAAFSGMPATIYLSALAYQTADSGILGAQAPAMITDNGDVDPDELLAIPVEALRDEDANGIYDRLEPGKGFSITGSASNGDVFSLTWSCFPGRSYRIQTCVNLSDNSWQEIPEIITAGAFDLTMSADVELDADEPTRFFRVMLVQGGAHSVAP